MQNLFSTAESIPIRYPASNDSQFSRLGNEKNMDIEQGCIAFPIAVIGAFVSAINFWLGIGVALLVFQAPLWTRATDQNRKNELVRYVILHQLVFLVMFAIVWGALVLIGPAANAG